MQKSGVVRHESLYVVLLLLSFLAFNISSATSYPYPNSDECMFVEPAISYIHGQGFAIHFSEMLSMYSFLLVPWIHLFGFSIRSIRSADIFFMATAFGLLWSGVKRLTLVSRCSYRLFMLVLLATDFGIFVSYRTGRYDGFGAFLLSLIFWSMSINKSIARHILLFTVCLIAPWAGLQYLPVIFAGGVVLFLLSPRRYWREIATSFLGVGLGIAGFISAVAISGRLPAYLKFVHSQQGQGLGMIAGWFRSGNFNHTNMIPADFSLPFLLAAAIALSVYLLRNGVVSLRSALPYSLAYSVLLTSILLISSRFPTYYSYMVSIPLAVAVCHGLSLCKASSIKHAVLSLCFVSGILGVGLNLGAYAGNWRDRNYKHVEQLVTSVVHPGDTAFVDYASYYAARKSANTVYFPVPDLDILPLMSEAQKQSITVLLVRREEAGNVIHGIGGTWNETGDVLAASRKGVFQGKGLGFLSSADYNIVVLRRTK